MKRITITIAVVIITLLACKKETKQKCFWTANKGNLPIYSWQHNKPSNDQVQKVLDTCSCSVTLEEHCFPCSQDVTDWGGNDVSCQ